MAAPAAYAALAGSRRARLAQGEELELLMLEPAIRKVDWTQLPARISDRELKAHEAGPHDLPCRARFSGSNLEDFQQDDAFLPHRELFFQLGRHLTHRMFGSLCGPFPFTARAYLVDGLSAIADPPPRLTGSAAATMPPSGKNSMAVAAPISAAEVNASPDGVNW